ncbi:hypothetical protein PG984_003647 [Apiospora sp. TS-2023a]
MSLPSHSFNAVAEPGGTAPTRQEQLEASLEALIGLDFGLFQGGSPEKRHLAPQIRHHDAHHHHNHTHTTPSSQRWADPSTQHDCAAPASHCGHACGNGQQARYMQALKNAVLLLSAQSMHTGSGSGGTYHESPQFSVPHLDFEAASNASSTPLLTPGDSCSTSLDDYDFSNNSFQFLDFEPGFGDTAMDYYTASTPRQQPSPSSLLSDTITVAPPPPRDTSAASDKVSKKRPRTSHDRDTISRRHSSFTQSPTQSPSPQDTQKPHRPHAAVEKRYRVSLNDKIEALRVCLESRKRPKRRQATTGEDGGSTTDGGSTATAAATADGRGGGATPTPRMSKAEVLTEAVEYVQQLEEENGIMLEQIEALVERMQATQRALQLPSFTAGRT